MLNEQLRLPSQSKKEFLQGELKRVRQEKKACGKKLQELNDQGKTKDMGDWVHTLMDLEKKEEKLTRALED